MLLNTNAAYFLTTFVPFFANKLSSETLALLMTKIFYLKRCLDEAEYAGVLRHSHIIRRVKLETFLILRDVLALTLVAPAFSATLYAT